MGWTELPAGHDVVIKAGFTYSALARVKVNHTKSDILARLQSFGLKVLGLDDPSTVNCGNTSSNYRCVGVMALATRDAGSVPWESPVPFLDSSGLIKAFYLPPGSTPLPAGASSNSSMAPIVVVGTIGLGALAWWAWRRKQWGKGFTRSR